MNITITVKDFDGYDYLFIPKDTNLTINEKDNQSEGWFNKFHRGRNNVYFQLAKGNIRGFTRIGITNTMIPIESARIKRYTNKAGLALRAIKGLR